MSTGSGHSIEQLEEGKIYAWCKCGQSSNQSWYNSIHADSEFAPKVFTPEESKIAAICMCKKSKNPPYCVGSHASL